MHPPRDKVLMPADALAFLISSYMFTVFQNNGMFDDTVCQKSYE